MYPRLHFILIVTGVVLGLYLLTTQVSPVTAPTQFKALIARVRPRPTIDPIAKNSPFDARFISFEESRRLSASQTLQGINRFVPNQGLEAKWQVSVYDLEFEVRVEDGSYSLITAEVYVPIPNTQQPQSDQSFPFIVYGAGTTGLNMRCAPTREDRRNPDLGNYANQMIAQASQGYIVALPNYEGLDTQERTRSYFNAELEARTLLGTALVMLQDDPADQLNIAGDQVFFGGYSQGGHAAFAATDKAELYAPQLKIGGVYGHGPTTDISDFLYSNPNLAPYFAYAYREYYPDFEVEPILSERWLGRLESARDLCVDEAFQFNSTNGSVMYSPDFWTALSAENADQALADQFPNQHARFQLNDAGTTYTDVPTLILQGRQDPIVTPEDQERFVNQLCQRGVPAKLQWYDGLHHFETRQRSFKDTNDWINRLVAGEAAESTCQ